MRIRPDPRRGTPAGRSSESRIGSGAVLGWETFLGLFGPDQSDHASARDVIEFGVVHRLQLGVKIQDVTEADAEVYGLWQVRGGEVVA